MSEPERLLSELQDLLKLDHDAVQAYSLAIEALEDDLRRETLRLFRSDHERHVAELEQLIVEQGATPASLPHVSGAFKLAVQAAATLGNDEAVLTAFRMNERQVRDRYNRAADGAYPPSVQQFLRRAVADENHHYAWATQTLRLLGHRTDEMEQRIAGAHQRLADTLEAGERSILWVGTRARRALQERDAGLLVGAGLAMLGGMALGKRLFG